MHMSDKSIKVNALKPTRKLPARKLPVEKSIKDTEADTKHTDNLPEVSKQTAGAIAGAVMGGVIAGPVGAVIVGVAGALVGNASAEGKRPIGKAVDSIRAVTEVPVREAYTRISNAVNRTIHPTDDSDKKSTASKKQNDTPKATKRDRA